jgi:cytochrome c biogenesis protein
MAEITANPRVMKRSPLEVGVDRVWRFFTSVRAAVYEVAILALLVLLGTLRGSSVPQNIQDIAPFTKPIITRWYAWNVFHSLPFMFILALLSVAIAICTANRAPGMWKSIAEPTITTSHGFIKNADINSSFSSAIPEADLSQLVAAAMKKRRYRVLTQERNGEIHLYADRFRFAKLGTYPFHLALILILIGGIVGARYGFRDQQFIVPDGSTRDIGHGTGLSVTLNHFSDIYREDGSPKEYRSDITLLKDGKPVKSGSVIVNHPITYNNVVIYQTSFGQAVSLRVTDSQGRELYNDSIPLGLFTAAGNPDQPAGVLDLPMVNAEVRVIAPDNSPSPTKQDAVNIADGQMFIQVRDKNVLTSNGQMPSAVVGQGETANLGGLNVTFVRERQFSLFQVASNPGIPIFWTAAFLLVGGLVVVFYFPHRRVRGIIAKDASGGTTAIFAPLAKRDWSGKHAFEMLVHDVDAALGVKSLIRTRDGGEEDAPEAALSGASS